MGDNRAEGAGDRKALSDHLADCHGVWLTRQEFKRATLNELKALDPCEHADD